jgi:serine/threonine protein kinase
MASKVVQEGTYGCVVKPPLPCAKTKAAKDNVGKIIKKKDTDIELSIATLVKAIKGWENYYVLQDEDNCSTQNFTNLRPMYASQCRVYTESENSELVQLLSPFSGKPVHGLNSTKISDVDYVGSLKHLLTAVTKLNYQGICHFDLHENNILIDDTGTMRIIDFGSAFLGDETTEYVVRRHVYDFSPKFPPQPPELAVQNAIYSGMDIDMALEQTVKQKRVYILAAKLLGMTAESSLRELKDFWSYNAAKYTGEQSAMSCYTPSLGLLKSSCSRKEKQVSWVPFFKMYWRSWDSWAVGVMFLNLLEKSFLNYTFVNTVWKNNSNKIRTVLKGLLHSNPIKRLTAEEALDLL